jgi:hypothetical protein
MPALVLCGGSHRHDAAPQPQAVIGGG